MLIADIYEENAKLMTNLMDDEGLKLIHRFVE
jgi:hypothetical protein